MKALTLIDVSDDFDDFEVPTILYDVYASDLDRIIGRLEYRDEPDEELYYYGNIGYVIYPPYRGRSYAYYACLELCDILNNELNIESVILTCNPDNIASKKTIEKLGAHYIKTVNVPFDHPLQTFGEDVKDVYRLKL